MNHRDKIQVDLIKLIGGDRLLRLTYLPSGLVLEKKLDSLLSLVWQKEQLFGVFEAAITQSELTVLDSLWIRQDQTAGTENMKS